MTAIHKSNAPLSSVVTLREIPEVTKTAQEIYDAYLARVLADGGSMGNGAACLAVIDAAIKGGYFFKTAIAISAQWGRKVNGSNEIVKFYNLVDATKDGTVAGTLLLDTTTLAWHTAKWDSADVVTFAGVNVNKTGRQGFVGSTFRAVDTAGIQMLFQPAAELWAFRDFQAATVDINGVKISSSPDAVVDNTAIGFLVEAAIGKCTYWADGAERKSTTNAITALAANATANVTISRGAIGDTYLNEYWFMNAATYAAVAACSFDVGARY